MSTYTMFDVLNMILIAPSVADRWAETCQRAVAAGLFQDLLPPNEAAWLVGGELRLGIPGVLELSVPQDLWRWAPHVCN